MDKFIIAGMPGCGKTFFPQKYIIPRFDTKFIDGKDLLFNNKSETWFKEQIDEYKQCNSLVVDDFFLLLIGPYHESILDMRLLSL